MPVIMFTEIGIVALGLGTIKMDPEQFPWIIFTADMGIFFRAVEKKAIAGHGRDSGCFCWGSIFVRNGSTAGEHDHKKVGFQSASFGKMGLQTF